MRTSLKAALAAVFALSVGIHTAHAGDDPSLPVDCWAVKRTCSVQEKAAGHRWFDRVTTCGELYASCVWAKAHNKGHEFAHFVRREAGEAIEWTSEEWEDVKARIRAHNEHEERERNEK